MKKKLLLCIIGFIIGSISNGQTKSSSIINNIPGSSPVQQGNGKISGIISDSLTGKPLEFAAVALINHATGKILDGTITDKKGEFLITKITQGSYQLQVSFPGYKSFTTSKIDIGNNEVKTGSIILAHSPEQLKEVKVTAERSLIEEKVDRLVYNAEKDFSTAGGTAADVLRNVPMLSVESDGTVQLRGSNNVRVLINNRPSTIMAGSIAEALRQIPADIIKSVEVITSPSAKYDAEGTAGIINIITKKNTLQGLTGGINIVPGNVSTIGGGNLNYRHGSFGVNSSIFTNQFYNRGATFLERYNAATETRFTQQGKTQNRSGFIEPRIGFDLSLSDKSSIGGGLSLNTGYDYVKNNQVLSVTDPEGLINSRNAYQNNRTNSLSYDVNLDYILNFKKPQQELSILGLFSRLNSDNQADQDLFNAENLIAYQQRNLNESQNTEITFQTDYTQPFSESATLETGAKTIRRYASSNVTYNNNFISENRNMVSKNLFSYEQTVYAGYFTYGFQVWKKLNLKIGSRYEQTVIDGDFETRNTTFQSNYHNLIPSLATSYTYKEKHTFKANFTQRIQRPQLYYLNPYREVVSPNLVLVGNPQLDAELTNLYETSYGTYTEKSSLNAGLYARTTQNSIASRSFLQNDTTYTTFLNIAKNTTFGINIFGSLKPRKGWNIGSNFNLYYAQLQNGNLSNAGWMYNLNANTAYDLGKGWLFRFNGSFNSRRVILQGRRASFFYHNLTVRKEMFNKRGGLGINLASPFMRGTRQRTNIYTPDFTQYEDNITYTRGIRLTIEYRFGKLEQAKPKRPKKTIRNDDALSS